ncbi:50S ribosomal protein L15 [Agrilactobacillus composti DSM 18527 = JCM 14202]|jgi:large subunit ribosomal protein L15|uniref:Large ribosomal subunit protein uL15 n=1 Tax=Agrilactobacillus composti DSM 18527 = JCM 14202 TaxID=1423734 RepID=X0PSB3_9LACO|nr:50S ribosomal protein L15 [Agrilactobacillus composti]KRM32605.1 50S ribosomal protein L15 [Agrilactobacillus composti DSM 18527 = JCM 14202]MCH4172193.1 50S ribosomal protein L15 [Lactobacillus sp.]GAF40081.1 LSU ribosomal protein L15p [Agrilactobacillus composti DSM 18527 = JCM 14202]
MKLHELEISEGARHSRKRVGRGTSSGTGKTAGRGQKGLLARSGGKTRPGFEGGQMPLYRRMPKRGFKNINRKEYAVINIRDLNKFDAGTEITPAFLKENGVIKNTKSGVKLLAKGELTTKLDIKVNQFSQAAKEAVEAAGGSIEVI